MLGGLERPDVRQIRLSGPGPRDSPADQNCGGEMSPYPGMALAYMPHSGQVCLIPEEDFDRWKCQVLCGSQLHGAVRLDEVPTCYYVCPRCERNYDMRNGKPNTELERLCEEILRMHANVDLVIDVEAAALDAANTWMAHHPFERFDSHTIFVLCKVVIEELITDIAKTVDTDDTVV